MVCLFFALSFPDYHLLCKQRKLLARQKSQFHPAKEVVHDRLRISKFLIAGPARGLEPSMRELVAEHLERHSMLQAHRDNSAETLHQSRDRRALLCHPDEDFARLSIRIKTDGQVTLMASVGEMVCKTHPYVRKAMPV